MKIDVNVHHHDRDGVLTRKLEEIMSKISDFVAAQQKFIDEVNTSLDGLQGDVAELNDKITALQNSAGEITPEDQVLLDDLQTKGEALATKAKALDDLTPPAAPPEDQGS